MLVRLALVVLCLAIAQPTQAQSDRALHARLDSLIQARAHLQQQITELEQTISDVRREMAHRAYRRLTTQGVELRVRQAGWLRSAPFPSADSLVEVPVNLRLTAGGYDRGFWQVQVRDTPGYLSDVLVAETPIAEAIKAGAATPPAGAAEATKDVALSPPEAHSTPPPGNSGERAAIQCSGITKKGTRCRRKTTHPSGYCHQHQE